MGESQIENYFVNICRKEGWLCEKLIVMNKRGFPDRTVFGPGWIAFVEFKTLTGKLSPQQRWWGKRLSFECGQPWYLCDSKESADLIISQLKVNGL